MCSRHFLLRQGLDNTASDVELKLVFSTDVAYRQPFVASPDIVVYDQSKRRAKV